MEKKLYRIMEGKKLAGVCTGLAEYFKLDVNMIRLIWVIVTLCAGVGLLAYIAAALLIPEAPAGIAEAAPEAEEKTEE